jgi:Fe-S-cluster containining protein
MPFPFTRESFFLRHLFKSYKSMNIPASLRPEINRLFEQMDRAYDTAARTFGFVCRGCRDNCCLTRFHHHTLLEYLYIQHGLSKLVPERLGEVKKRAQKVLDRMTKLEQCGEPVRVMCPLNEDGRCMLYAHRPMICRLHGIPHALRRPDGRSQTGPGCDDFYAQCGNCAGEVLDRTPIYIAMADLEQKLRQALGFDRKIKMTIADIVLDEGFRF